MTEFTEVEEGRMMEKRGEEQTKEEKKRAYKKWKTNDAATNEKNMEEDGGEDGKSVRIGTRKYEEEGETKRGANKGKRKME